jgi:hypothetical protein
MTSSSAAHSRVIRFEVATRRDGRWSIECARDRESEAIAIAKEMLATSAYEAVRVMRERDVFGRTMMQASVFEASLRGRDEPPIKLSSPDESDCWCSELDDLYGARSRRVIGQMLRPFLDQFGITPTELLHNLSFGRKLDEAGTLLSSAIHRISLLRANATGESLAESVRFLERLISTALRRAVDARANRRLSAPGADGLDPLVERLAALTPDPAERRFQLRCAASLACETERSLLARLVRVLGWAPTAQLPESVAVIDEMIADCLGSATVVQEMLGAQPELGTALHTTIEIARGRPVETPPRAAKWYPDLAAFLAGHPCPDTRTVLLVRVHREIAGDTPLTRGSAVEESRVLLSIAGALKDDTIGGYVGGARMVEAMVRRWSRLDQPGGFSDMKIPATPPAERFAALLGAEPDHYGETKKRALATLLIDALREVPLDRREPLRQYADAIENSKLLAAARRSLLREIAAGG